MAVTLRVYGHILKPKPQGHWLGARRISRKKGKDVLKIKFNFPAVVMSKPYSGFTVGSQPDKRGRRGGLRNPGVRRAEEDLAAPVRATSLTSSAAEKGMTSASFLHKSSWSQSGESPGTCFTKSLCTTRQAQRELILFSTWSENVTIQAGPASAAEPVPGQSSRAADYVAAASPAAGLIVPPPVARTCLSFADGPATPHRGFSALLAFPSSLPAMYHCPSRSA